MMNLEQKERNELIHTLSSPGWRIFEDWVWVQIKKNQIIPSKRELTDEDIIKHVRNSRLKVDVYQGILNFAQEEVKNGSK